MNYFLKSLEPGAALEPPGTPRAGDTITVETDEIRDVTFVVDGFPDLTIGTKTVAVNAALQLRQRVPGTWEFASMVLSQ
jgi:hypothetical protein